VSIGKPINDKIVRAARGTKNEIIGLLIGRLQDNTIIIEDSITGESSAEPHRAILSSNALAKIADELVTGRIKGNIVGWYHSHTYGGLFFSETDIATQRKLQQFSTLIAGMVVDASNGDVGFFRVEPQTGQAVRVPVERITVYAERSEAIPPQARAKTPIAPPIAEVRGPTSSQIRTLGLFGALAPIVYVAAVVIGGFLWPGYSQYSQTVSTLTSARAPNQAIMVPLFAFYNVCVILLAVGFYYGIQKEIKHIPGPVFLAATGAGGLVLFLFPQDYPQSPPVSIFGTLHLVVAGIVTIFSLAAMALFWHHFRLYPRWKGYGLFSIVMLPIALVLGVFGVISLSAPYAGLADRLSIGSILFWMETLSIGLVLRSSKNPAS
jgi:proteasome lid subunit RPN8/RPN11